MDEEDEEKERERKLGSITVTRMMEASMSSGRAGMEKRHFITRCGVPEPPV